MTQTQAITKGHSLTKYLLYVPPDGHRLWVYIHILAFRTMHVFPPLDSAGWNASIVTFYVQSMFTPYSATFDEVGSGSSLHHTCLIEISRGSIIC